MRPLHRRAGSAERGTNHLEAATAPTLTEANLPTRFVSRWGIFERQDAAAAGIEARRGNFPFAQGVSESIEREAFSNRTEIEVKPVGQRGERVRGRIERERRQVRIE